MLKLHMHKVPPRALDLVSAELAAFPKRTYGNIDLNQVDPDQLEAGIPFRVFEAGIDLDSGELRIERSQPKGAGMLVRDGQHMIAGIFLATDSSGKATHVQHTSFGPFAENFAQALREAERTLTHGEYELRLLRVSGLHFELLWLSARDGSGDHFFTVMSVPGFTTSKHFQSGTLAALLRPHLKPLAEGGEEGAGAHAP